MHLLRALPPVLLPLTLACAQAPHGAAAPDAAVSAAELRAHVEVLAGDEMEGRRAGSGMDLVATDYLAAQLRAAGLQPAGENGSWFQEFEVELEPSAGDCSLSWSGGTWSDVGTVQASASGEAAAPMVAAGYGMVLESHDQNDFETHGVSGKVALVRRYTLFGPNADPQFAALGNLRAKIKNAAAAGAVAVVLGTHPEDVDKGGEAVIDFTDVRGTMPIPVVTVSPERFAQLEEACGGEGGTAPGEASVSATVETGTATTRNVLAWIPGEREELVVIGAHYDHLGWGGQGSLAPGVHEVHNGADDNASGSAVVLELAEHFAQRGEKPGRGILFAFWGAEEIGLNGSLHWVGQPTLPAYPAVANLNLDMVGRLAGGSITVGSHATAAAFGPALEAAQAALDAGGADLELKLVGSESPGGGGSDHMSFHGVKIPAVFFFSGLHSDYHKPSDDPEKLDYARMAALAGSVAVAADAVADAAPGALAWVAPTVDPDAEQRTVTAAKVWFGSIPDYSASPEDGGMQIAGTSPGGPAEKAGLQKGDIIKKVGDFEIVDIYDFMDSLGSFSNGDTIDVVILRGEERLTLKLTFFPRATGD
jgi:aminopeptidase YwaD